jgi:hypothetical protein
MEALLDFIGVVGCSDMETLLDFIDVVGCVDVKAWLDFIGVVGCSDLVDFPNLEVGSVFEVFANLCV